MGDNLDHFEIGKKNFTTLRKLLWKNNLPIKAHHIGGSSAKTLSLDIKTGKVNVKSDSEAKELS